MVYNPPTVLIVDDDEAICELISEGLLEDGFSCDTASTADEALTKFRGHYFDIALLDIKLPGKSGMELLKIFQTISQNTEIVMITAVKDIDTAIQAMKLGASDYVVKPFTIDKLSASIDTILGSNQRCSSVSGAVQPMGIVRHGAKTASRSLNEINSIAFGVDAQVDYFDFHSQIVTERTVGLARQFGLPDKDIKKWAESRKELYSKRDSYISSISHKLERNPLAQVMLGIAQPVFEIPKLRGEQN